MSSRRILDAAGVVFMAMAAATVVFAADAQDASVGIHKMNIYPEIGAAAADLKLALAQARGEHKRVIVDFGGDWCLVNLHTVVYGTGSA